MIRELSLRFATFMLRTRRAVTDGMEGGGGECNGVYVFYGFWVVRGKGGLLGHWRGGMRWVGWPFSRRVAYGRRQGKKL